jgi:ferredoxin-type protein NapG
VTNYPTHLCQARYRSIAKNLRLTRQDRRRLLRTALLAGGVLGAALSGLPAIGLRAKTAAAPARCAGRKDFLGSCIKCGQCVQVCPVQAIKLADLVDGFGVGVPYIDARAQACDFSCDAVQCILACPTGSLAYHKPANFCRCAPVPRWPPKPIAESQGKRPGTHAQPEGTHGCGTLDAP